MKDFVNNLEQQTFQCQLDSQNLPVPALNTQTLSINHCL